MDHSEKNVDWVDYLFESNWLTFTYLSHSQTNIFHYGSENDRNRVDLINKTAFTFRLANNSKNVPAKTHV